MPRERVRSTLLAIDHADRCPTDEPGLPERLHGLLRRASARDDVLDEAHLFPGLELAFDPVLGPVALRLFADDEERQAAGERGRRSEGDRPELGPRESPRVRRGLADPGCYPLAQLAQEVGPRLEAVLVQVVPLAPARTQDEVSFEERVFAEQACELCVRHPRAAASARRASGSSRSPSGEPGSSETIEPSAK